MSAEKADTTKKPKAAEARSSAGTPKVPDRTLSELSKGSHKAFRDIYLTYKESVEYFLIKLLRSEDDAAEMTQNIFVNIWEKRENIDPTKNIKSYLFSAAKNMALDYFKHQKVQYRHAQYEQQYRDILDYDSDDELIAQEMLCMVELTVSRMPKIRRTIFEMSRRDNLSNEDIAKKLNMNKHTVANHISHALRDIKEILILSLMFMI